MKHCFILLSFFCILHCNGQTYSSLLGDSTILNFLQWDLHHDKIYSHQDSNRIYLFCNELIPWDSSEIMIHEAMTKGDSHFLNDFHNVFLELRKNNITELTEDDRIFIEKQFCSFTRSTSLRDIDASIKLKRCTRSSSKKHVVQSFSLPLFSLDQSVVIIKRSSRGLHNFLAYSLLVYKKISINDYKLIYWQTVYPDTL